MGLRSIIFAATYDRQMTKVEALLFHELRHKLLADITGDVLEIGAGTGVNIGHYGSGVDSLAMTEPEQPMLRRLGRKAKEQAPWAKVLRAPAEDLPFNDDSFDFAVSTLVLCGVSDQQRALRELRRVLRPGGQLLFVEHVRSDEPKLARHQDRMNWLSRLIAGCDCNRPTVTSIDEAGFTVTDIAHDTMPKAPKFLQPVVTGRATAPGNGRPPAREP